MGVKEKRREKEKPKEKPEVEEKVELCETEREVIIEKHIPEVIIEDSKSEVKPVEAEVELQTESPSEVSTQELLVPTWGTLEG